MKISIQGLKQGVTRFAEEVSSDFINENYAEYYPNKFSVVVDVDKIDRDLRVTINIQSTASYSCDSCLIPFEESINVTQEQIFEIGPDKEGANEDIIFISHDTTELDLTTLLSESVILNHPIQMRCHFECKGLCQGCGADLNLEKCTCVGDDIDPRWEKLRKLIK